MGRIWKEGGEILLVGGRRPKYILGFWPYPMRHYGPKIDQQWGRSKTLSFTNELWLLRLREVGRGGVSPQLNKWEVRKWVLIFRVIFQKVLLIRICIVNVWDNMEAEKYLKKCCYRCIECFATNSLTAFMWRRPLNSVALIAPTHREPMRVSDGTNTQVVAWMIDKWKAKIIQGEIYNVRDS